MTSNDRCVLLDVARVLEAVPNLADNPGALAAAVGFASKELRRIATEAA